HFSSSKPSTSVQPAQSSIIAIRTALLVRGIRAEAAVANFSQQLFDPEPHVVENHFVYGMRDHRIAGRAEEQISPFDTHARVCAQSPSREVRIHRNLERLLQLLCGGARRSGVFEVIDTNGIDDRTVAM